MAEQVTHISDRPSDERSSARAISELLVRVGALEGHRAALQTEVESLRLLVGEVRTEIDRALHSIRTQTGRSVAAADRVRKAQVQLDEALIQTRRMMRENHIG